MALIDLSDIETKLDALMKKSGSIAADQTRAANDSLEWMMEIKKMIEDAPKIQMIEKIDKMIADILSKDYSPIINLETDNKEIVQAIQSDNQSIIVLLTEIKAALSKKATGFEFERDSQGFIKSPIKITYGSR